MGRQCPQGSVGDRICTLGWGDIPWFVLLFFLSNHLPRILSTPRSTVVGINLKQQRVEETGRLGLWLCLLGLVDDQGQRLEERLWLWRVLLLSLHP